MGESAEVARDPGGPAPSIQYLTFRLAEEEYAVPILAVHEIQSQSSITPIPNAPVYLPGVMNLRGTIVPVVNLRVKFGLPEPGDRRFDVIVLVAVGAKIVGMIVDAVTDVLSIRPTEIQPLPDIGAARDVGVVSGIARAGEKLVVLLDVARVLDEDARFTLAGIQ